MNMEVELVKTLVLVGLFLISFITGFIPLKLFSYYQDESKKISGTYHRVISIMSCFAAGIFMATCLMDLLPETREELGETLNSGKFADYPIAEFIMVIGLMLMLTIEQTVMVFQEKQKGLPVDGKHFIDNEEKTPMLEEKSQLLISKEHQKPNSTAVTDNDTYNLAKGKPLEKKSSVASSLFKSLALIIALTLHSMFEGLAVGLKKESSDVVEIFIGLAIHKAALAFSLGMTLTQSKITYWGSLRSLFAFAIASPVGIAIGLIILEYGSGSSSSLAVGILQGIACGTFLYVTFFELLQRELRNMEIRLLKVFAASLGFIIMSAFYLI